MIKGIAWQKFSNMALHVEKKCTNYNKRFTFITVLSISFISIQKHNLSLWWRNWNFKNSSLLLRLPKMYFNYTTQGSRFLSVLSKCCLLRIYMETRFLWSSVPSKTQLDVDAYLLHCGLVRQRIISDLYMFLMNPICPFSCNRWFKVFIFGNS